MNFKDIVSKIREDVNRYIACMECGREIHEEDAIVIGYTDPGMKTKQCICTNCATYMMSGDPSHLAGVEESQTGEELVDLFLDWCTTNGEICDVANFDRYIKTIEDAEPHPDDITYARKLVSNLAISIGKLTRGLKPKRSVKESHLSTIISRVKNKLNDVYKGDEKKASYDKLWLQSIRNLDEYMRTWKDSYTSEEADEASDLYAKYAHWLKYEHASERVRSIEESADETGMDLAIDIIHSLGGKKEISKSDLINRVKNKKYLSDVISNLEYRGVKVIEMASSFGYCSTCKDTTTHSDIDGKSVCTRCNRVDDRTSAVKKDAESEENKSPDAINQAKVNVIDQAKAEAIISEDSCSNIDKTQLLDEMRCPKCKHQFTTQCRCGSTTSEDGKTVKYECEKCGHKFVKKYDKPVWESKVNDVYNDLMSKSKQELRSIWNDKGIGPAEAIINRDKIDLVLDIMAETYTEEQMKDLMPQMSESKMNEYIKQVGSKWRVVSKSGKNMGTYDTKEEAVKRLGQIEFFKKQ